MNLKKLVLLIAFLIPYMSYAQAPHVPQYNNGLKCGISSETAALIKQRLMDNRNALSKQEVTDLLTNRTITYIPVSIHNVANDASGLGKTSEATILSFLCGLNALYADQDIQFFIQTAIYNKISIYIYNNAGTSTARGQMLSYRIPGTLNMVIGASAQNQVASWYDGAGDFVFLLQSMLTAQAKTEAHEIGHFFGLPHTFSGWEGQDVTTMYTAGSNVACQIGGGWSGFTPETVPRTGSQANCSNRGDLFCDTPADYFSDRTPCPYSFAINDCHGNALNPDETLLMSYAYDQCVSEFSNEQKAAIAADVALRSWATNTPNSTADVTGTPTAVSPLNNAQLGDINNPTVRLEWTPVTGATWYFLEVYGTMIPGLWLPNTNDLKWRGIIYNNNGFYNLPTSLLTAGSRYAWRVKAFNSVSTCAPISGFNVFEAVANVTTDIKDLPIEKQMTFNVNSNPITTSSIPLSIYSAEDVVGSIRIYAMDGREVMAVTKEVISQGESIIQLPAGDLSNGMYVAVLSTDRGQLQQKLIIQR